MISWAFVFSFFKKPLVILIMVGGFLALVLFLSGVRSCEYHKSLKIFKKEVKKEAESLQTNDKRIIEADKERKNNQKKSNKEVQDGTKKIKKTSKESEKEKRKEALKREIKWHKTIYNTLK